MPLRRAVAKFRIAAQQVAISNTAALAWHLNRNADWTRRDGFRYGTPGAIVASASTMWLRIQSRSTSTMVARIVLKRHGIHDRGLVVRRSGDIAANSHRQRSPMPRGAGFLLTDFSSEVCWISMLQFTDGPERNEIRPHRMHRESGLRDFAVHRVYRFRTGITHARQSVLSPS